MIKRLLFWISIISPAVLVGWIVFSWVFLAISGDVNAFSKIDPIIRIVGAIGLFGTILGQLAFLFMEEVPALEGKKGLWSALILFGNIFVVPVFALIHLNNRRTL